MKHSLNIQKRMISKDLDKITEHYDDIKNTIGVKQMNEDNKSFKELILKTQKYLDNLKGKYIWDL